MAKQSRGSRRANTRRTPSKRSAYSSAVVRQRSDEQGKFLDELGTKALSLGFVPARGDQQVELGLGPNPDTPGHSRRFSSVNPSSAVRPRLPSAANEARRRLISAICQSGSGSVSARGARLAQISSIRSSRSDTLRPASSVAFGMDATCATLHLRIAPRKECPADDSGSALISGTSCVSVAIQTIHG